MSAFLLGLGISTAVADDPLREAVEAERLGYDFVSASDHPMSAHPPYETWTLLTWIAARTTRIGVASRVLGVPFRRPVMVAKAAESLQRLSAGRLILGLGGGWDDAEIAAVGGPSLTPGQKVRGMADAITAIRATWTDPGTPIWLGTYGPRALAVTGQLADGWIPSLGFAPPERIPTMLDQIRAAAVGAGRSVDSVRAIYNVPVRLGTHRARDEATVTGAASDVIEQLRAFVDLGFTGFNLILASPADVAAVAAEVLPELRAVRTD